MDASPSQSKPGEDSDVGGGQETMCIISQEAYNNAATGGSLPVPHEPGDGSPTVVVAEAFPLPTPVVVVAEASPLVAVFAPVAANITESVKEVEIGPGITLGFHSHTEYSFIIATVPKVVDDLHYI